MPVAPAEHDGITGVTFGSGGHRLLGTLYLARGGGPKPTALLLHGCPGLQQNGDLAVALRDRGWNSLIFHYRGSWGSGGRYDLRTVPADVTAAVDHLSSGACPLVDAGRLAVVGHSLGGWAALLAAAGDPRLRAVAACAAAVDIGALDLDPAAMEREFTRFLAVTPDEFRRQRDEAAARLDPLAAAAAIAPRPLLIVHGTADPWVPVAHARRLAGRARQPFRYAEIDGGGHDFAWERSYFRELVTGWLDEIQI
jgi:dipeptidyl aminopeptidase/acylaminoacyl peptidase